MSGLVVVRARRGKGLRSKAARRRKRDLVEHRRRLRDLS